MGHRKNAERVEARVVLPEDSGPVIQMVIFDFNYRKVKAKKIGCYSLNLPQKING